jgi:MSHA biogenesis protein MshJ
MQLQIVTNWLRARSIVNSRSQRERALLFVTGIVLIWIFMFNVFISPMSRQNAYIEDEQANVEQQYQGTLHELVALKEKVKHQGGLPGSVERQELETIVAEHNELLSNFRSKLITSQNVPALLESMLKDFAGLTLLKVETLPPQKLSEMINATFHSTLYRHSIKLTFLGEYQQLLQYLQQIENLPYPVWWDVLDYKITHFPQAQIELTVYIISENINWIGI